MYTCGTLATEGGGAVEIVEGILSTSILCFLNISLALLLLSSLYHEQIKNKLM